MPLAAVPTVPATVVPPTLMLPSVPAGHFFNVIELLQASTTPGNLKYYRAGWATGSKVFVSLSVDLLDPTKTHLVLNTLGVGDGLGIRKAITRWTPTWQDLITDDWNIG